jgi:hypothetical protein
MEKHKIVLSIASLFLSIVIFMVSVFAWFTLTDISKVNEVDVPVGQYDAEITLEVKKNDLNFVVINNQLSMLQVFTNAVPSDTFHFRLTIENTSSLDTHVAVSIINPVSSNVIDPFSKLDVFYIDQGQILVDSVPTTLVPNNITPYIVAGQEMNLYRLSNLVNNIGNLLLVSGEQIATNESIVVEFILIYDQNTSNQVYQNAILNIDFIRITLR